MEDRYYMEHALRLASAGAGHVTPNPLVGAVLVRNGQVIGEGWHARYGGPHAEQAAIDHALQQGNDPRGATLYCTLEPCSFTAPDKHNPPCTTAIRTHGIRTVVLAIVDPNPRVRGSGIAQLKQAGIEVRTGVCARKAVRQNEAYILSREQRRPYIVLKWAQSLDGCMATGSHDSKWISSPSAREEAHHLRGRLDAVMVGSGTAAHDDPQLTVRTANNRYPQPLRVVVSRHGNLRKDSHLVTQADTIPTRLYCTGISPDQQSRLTAAGIQVIPVEPDSESLPSLHQVMQHLYDDGIQSILVEGGARLHASLLRQGLYDRITAFTEPVFLGDGLRPTDNLHPATVAAAPRLLDSEFHRFGSTISISGLHPDAARLLHDLIPDKEASCSPV
ncbi:bifunctional diaminohydroxyphosphoribosylaminopyrimidine deaminase/5-amino-6-(5-phosphoribosylamino)uracil reductase RibD [Spirochaeta africana]|uniref:Riboflavin biosynthesis protein RibD n=1 Tax=Spirochaeta africana (strain ATCC 700263 / DSM 8902 / Z-7692) TaxID=889378 RepID=H9UIQ6_SPIAZ|nr:bifunctional diaminohydroxyphosphoribosylaminopyrimidine deaminase/5-amino-6-(5-phosphoribosylamino)uracil reductase RibD [Spirochaeta africana]AFG37399.1 riboflavin biosynthesis protein RibD [Spirochaeta africana DSM 8902]